MQPSLTFAIADVHGRADKLAQLHSFINSFNDKRKTSEIVYLGDLIDRGPSSKDVLEMVSQMKNECGAVIIKGNHDEWMRKAVAEGCDASFYKWTANGGVATLGSYSTIDFEDALFRIERRFNHHLQLLTQAKSHYIRDRICFTHAGLRPGVALSKQSEYDMMWIGSEFTDFHGHFDHVVVHGHTVVGERPVITENRISLDTGAYDSGLLTCMVVDWDMKVVRFFQTQGDAVMEVEPVLLDRGYGLATDFIFQDEDYSLAA